jgi:hypothetical protein
MNRQRTTGLFKVHFKINGQAITVDQTTHEDVAGDGDFDQLLHFWTKDVAGILTPATVDLALTAEFGVDARGHDLGGTDAIKVVPR